MIQIKINTVDVTDQIEQGSLEVVQRITNQVDTANFSVRKAGSKTLTPSYGDEVEVYDGATKIFGGTVLSVQQAPTSGVGGIEYFVHCVDHNYTFDKLLASKTYTGQSITAIITDLVSSYAPTFTVTNVNSGFIPEKIVFNQVPLTTCLKRLADIVNYDWYIDEDKDVHFFQKYANIAPFNLTDTDGNHIYKTLRRTSDGSQIANRIKVRGGEYDSETYSDSITVSGDESKAFSLPYKFANLTVTLDTGGGPVSQNVGIDFINDFSTDDVLYNFQNQMIRFENNLTDGDVIAFTGNPKVPVFAVAEDPVSIAEYGKIEKLLRDGSIESNTVARRRANAELYLYAEPVIDASFGTHTAGLRAGMLITIQSTNQSIATEELIIKNLSFRMRGHDTFEYKVDCVSTKRYDFINLLQKLLEPEARASDERETSEEIFSDTQAVTVEELYEVVSAQEDFQQVEVQENYEIDPLGADTNAIYVLGPYTPTGQDDTKRPGRLNISLVAY